MTRSDYLVVFIISQLSAFFLLLILFTLRGEVSEIHSFISGFQWVIFIVSPILHFVFLGFFSLWPPMVQFSRFCMISFSNLMIDFGVLNLLIYYSGVAEGILYSVFKAVSFLLANVNSYSWNRSWTFRSGEIEKWRQIIKFLAVVGTGLLINVFTASLVVVKFSGAGSLSATLWANIAAGVSLVVTLFWNFFGLKHIVFAKKGNYIE